MSPLNSFWKVLTRKVPHTHEKVQASSNRFASFIYNPKRPYFTRLLNEAMLVDPHIQYGLYLIKGPIYSNSRFIVKSENEELRQFIIDQLTRFWRTSAQIALESMDYGWYGCEIMYRYHEGRLQFDYLDPASPLIVRPFVDKGVLSAVSFESDNQATGGNINLLPPKAFWTVHNRKKNRWFGQSRLYGSHIPWVEYNGNEGYRDSRQLHYYKNAFSSGTLYYPEGSTIDTQGRVIPNSDTADLILERKRNGSAMSLPRGGTPEQSWEYVEPTATDLGEGFIQYGRDLKEEMLEGLGVPPEVARAEGTGAYAGRQVPFEAFYSMLEEITNEIITDFDSQILQFLVKACWGNQPADYSIESLSIDTEDQTQDKANLALANQDKKMPDEVNPLMESGQPIQEQPKLFSMNYLSDGLVYGADLRDPRHPFEGRVRFRTHLLRHSA